MERVIVIGSPGAGKSTFSRKLSAVTHIPLYYLDMLWHKPDKTTYTYEEFDEKLNHILKGEKWITDGNYSRTLKLRLDKCDTVIWFDIPADVCLNGVISRQGKVREDMPWVEVGFDEEFMSYIKNFPNTKRLQIQELLKNAKDKEIIVFHSRNEADEFIKKFDETLTMSNM